MLGLQGGGALPLGPTSSELYMPGYFAGLSGGVSAPGHTGPVPPSALGAGYHAIPLVAELSARKAPSQRGTQPNWGQAIHFHWGSRSAWGPPLPAPAGYYCSLTNREGFTGIDVDGERRPLLLTGASHALFSGIPALSLELGGRYREASSASIAASRASSRHR
ncbi:MAG: hypothetical protein M0C28_06105 [Candidatus Moduliflexus flocculans]|nr:hypothetical protein [Candidatus Moduliflexus flocculans]